MIYRRRDLHWARLLGLALMVAGVLLVALFRGDEVKDLAILSPPSQPASEEPLPHDDETAGVTISFPPSPLNRIL